ncbi:MAG: hypothetical protein JWR69_2663, partial [Pedosphaera sp.]|nr:hypothetical protein [Pedosphaera sp.]
MNPGAAQSNTDFRTNRGRTPARLAEARPGAHAPGPFICPPLTNMTLATLQPAAPAPVALPAQKYVLAIQRPFVDMALLQFVLDISEDQALWLIEEGSIAFAFNLKTKKARLPYLRILTQSVLDHVNRQSSLGEDAELKRHLECIFPPTVNPTAQALASTFT